MKRVFVGLSGGVDSAVSAALLKERGFDVVGAFIKIWSPEWLGCTSREDRLDAMRVAAHLDIPFRDIDLTAEYKKDVVDYMIREYKAGRTPNPDVFCNKYIKFGIFFDWVISQGADFVATGHYAQVKEESGTFKMLAGADKSKDQSYFLWTLTQKQLSKTMFPVGDIKKSDVRKIAKRFRLPNSERRDSQGLCFVGPVDVKDFLAEYAPQKEGNVLDEKGNIIGFHPGALFFTIGERHGFTITEKSPNDRPYFIIAKNMKNNTIIVASEHSAASERRIGISDASWIAGAPNIGHRYSARLRYRAQLSPCVIFEMHDHTAKIGFDEPQEAVTPGQSLVLYDGDTCLGGGIIY
jgi:tRNA-specific 2-thiouridylase